MTKIFFKLLLTLGFIAGLAHAGQLKGLNVLITSDDVQTQTMGMVLSAMTLKKHGKKVNIVLCGPAGALALKNSHSPSIKRPDGTELNPKMMLQNLIKGGANAELCPIYLPNAGKKTNDMLEGITIAKPPVVADRLLDSDYNNVQF